MGSCERTDVSAPDLDRERRILDVLRALDAGEVTTYGDVAEVAGYPKQARLVGRILATTDVEVPWWRVVNAVGRIVSGHPDEQADLLRAEGVVVVDRRVIDAPVGRFRRSRSVPLSPERSSDP
jgi:methylated-DNA-protein-cysteine methyltransferase-like protein